MKKLIFLLIAVIFSTIISAQTIVFHENFESPSLGDSLITTADTVIGGNNTPTTNFKSWVTSTNLFKSGLRSDTNSLQPLKTIYLTSLSFSTLSNYYVILQFSQICKLHFADGGKVQVSVDNGANWIDLTPSQYLGSGTIIQNKFSENAYSTLWAPGDTLTKPTNSWWKDETFDISSLASNKANVKIRFMYYSTGQASSSGRYGWLIDDVKVTASPCELVPPSINMNINPIDTITNAGPYNVSAYVRDNTGIDTVFLQYQVGIGTFNTVVMTKSPTVDSLYSASIPFYGWGKTISYHIIAKDNSCAHNLSYNPSLSNLYYKFFCKFPGSPALTQDAGAYQVIYPNGGVIAGNPFNVIVKIKNFGSKPLAKATLNWTTDGTLKTSSLWTGNLAKDSISIDFILGNLNLTAGPHSLKIWTTLPNDSVDQNNINDTIYYSFFACQNQLNGVYTVGGTGSNFPTFADAINGLTQCGINGPVVFNINPGIYSEQLTLPFISGSSFINTITFKSANSDSSSVILNYGTNISTKNWILNLSGAKYFTFKNITFSPGTLDSAYSNAILFTNGASNNYILGNKFLGRQSGNINQALIRVQDTLCYNNKIIGNNFDKGYTAVALQGTINKLIPTFEISKNIISNFTNYGIFCEYVKPVIIDNNIIITSYQSNSSNYGIYLHYTNDSIKVTRNIVNISGSTNNYGIWVDNCHADTSKKGLVANNFISLLNGNNFTYGIRIINSDYQKIYFNSIITNGNSATDTRCINPVSSNYIEVYNNNLQSNVYPIYVEQTSVSKADYNNYYSTGTSVAYWSGVTYSSVSALRNATGKDLNSISTNPYFYSPTNLHTINGLLKGMGKSFVEVPIDIDGQNRPDPPCIGADEFVPSTKDATLLAFMMPTSGCGLSTTADIKIVIKNIGSTIISPSTMNVVYKINNSVPITPEFVNRTINPGDTIQYVFNTKANLSVQSIIADSTFNFMSWVNLTGDSLHYNDTIFSTIVSRYIPPMPSANDTLINYATTASLHATSTYPTIWFDVPSGGSSLQNGYTYTTPILYVKDTFYVETNTGFSTNVVIGNGNVQNTTMSYPSPYGQFYTGSKEQYLILASELSALGAQAGPIQSLDFNVVSYGGQAMVNYTLKIGSTSLNSLTTSFVSTSLTSVYSNPSLMPTTGWNTYNFNIPYLWDGISNIVIETCFDNYAGASDFTENAIVNQSTTTFNSSLYYHYDGGSVCTYSTGTTSFQRPNIRINVSQLGCPSNRKSVIVDVTSPPPVDAGLIAVSNPNGSVPAGTSQPIVVKLKNYGLNNLTNATISYKINGILQTPSYNWTGNLAHDSILSVNIDYHTFKGGLYNIQSWVSNPNGISNTVASNDSASTVFLACLNGVYTIGDTTGGLQHDYPTFNAAVNTLSIAGICGSVIFNVDTGTYNEQVLIPSISGTSPNSTITFQSANGINTSATLQFNASSSASSYTLKFDGANNIIFKNLTLKELSTNYGHVVEMVNSSNNISFNNNIIELISNTSTYLAGIYSSGNNNTVITNNKILRGYYSIYLNGTSSNPGKNNFVKGNYLNGFYEYGIFSNYQDSISILQNTIISDTISGNVYGIYAYYNNNTLGINKNKITLKMPYNYTYGTCEGIYNYLCSGLINNYNLISNNFILISGGGVYSTCYGINSSNSNYQKYYFNSVKVNSVLPTTGIAFSHSNGTFINVVDNNLINLGGGYAFYTNSPTSLLNIDNNNFYTTDTNFVYWNGNKSNLNLLISASGFNIHSINANPQFISLNDLHLLSTLLSGYGIPIPEVSDDIDGQIRHLTAPTIGADEFPMIPKDAGVVYISSPGSIETEANSIPVKVAIRNFGTDTIHSMSIKYKVNNGTVVNYNYVGSLPSLAVDTVLLPNFIIPAGYANICAYTALVGDTNLFNDQYCKNFFGTPLFDAQLVSIVPIVGGCNLTTAKTVTIKIKNTGLNNITGNLSASYNVIGSSNINTQTVSSPINSGDTLMFIFTTPVDLSVTTHDSTFIIKSWVTLLNDHVQYNDTAFTRITSLHTPPQPTVTNVTIPYGTPVTLIANSATNDPINWFVQLTGGTQINLGPTYLTPILYNSSTYYIESKTILDKYLPFGTGTVTNTTNSYPSPYGLYYTGSREQYLILASELIAQGIPSGPIISCGFDVVTPTTPSSSGTGATNTHLKNLSIKMGATALNALTSNYITGITQVYLNPMYKDVVGWNMHDFNTPFIWDGVSNIVVDVCFDKFVTAADYGTNAVVNQTSTPFASTLYSQSDAANQCLNLTGTLINQRPNIKFILAGCTASPRVPLTVTVNPQSSKDIGVTSIITPATGINLTNHETVKIYVTNFGFSPAYNFTVKYQVNNGPVVSETFNDTILANAVNLYTFQNTANLGTVGDTFKIKAYTVMNGDATAMNDTTRTSIINKAPVYCVSTALYNSYTDIGNVTFAGINNGNPTPGTNNANADKLYTDYSNLSPAQVHIGATYPISIRMMYQYGFYSGALNAYIDYNRNGTWETNEKVFSTTYSDTLPMTANITVPVNANSGVTRLRVVADQYSAAAACGTYSYGETEDYTVNIIPPIPKDAGIVVIVKPLKYLIYNQANSTQPKLVIRNWGTDTLSHATVYYKLNGNLNSYNWSKTPALLSFATDTFNIPNVLLNDGMNSLTAYTVLAGDTNSYNDTTSIKIFKEHLASIPYLDNFENDKYWFATDTNGGSPITNLWQQGTPSSSVINSAHSPNNAWKTLLNKNYPVGNTSILYSPKFHFGLTMGDTLKFWHWRHFGLQTYGRIDYLNVFNSWVPLGTANDPNATNWYSTNAGFTGTGTGWELSTYKVSNLADLGNYTQFRFIFDGAATLPTDTAHNGWAFDDVSLSLVQIPQDAGVVLINTPNGSSITGDSVAPSVTIKNFGLNPITTFPIKYMVNYQLPVSETWAGNLLPGTTTSYTFNHKYFVNTADYIICAATYLNGDSFYMNDSTCQMVTVNPAANDVGVIEIVSPSDSVGSGTTVTVTVKFKNFGTNPVTSIPLTYQRGSQTPVNATWNGGPLNFGDTASYTFSTTFPAPIGNSFNICAWTSLIGDAYPPNNKLCKSSILLGIDDIFNADDLWLGQNTPNPSNGLTVINYNLPQAGEINFNLTDLLGRSIYSKQEKAIAGKHKLDLNVSELPDGVYYYSIEFKGKRLVKKMMITK